MTNIKKRGHHSLVFAAALMSAAAGAAALSLGTVWFVSKKGRATFDLWTFTVEPFGGQKIEASHEKICADASLDLPTSFCHKVRATRAMVFLTIITGLYSMVALIVDYWRFMDWLFFTAALSTVLANICLICSIALGIAIANDSTDLDKPKHGFFMICLGALFAFAGLVLEIIGATRGPRFKNKSQKFRKFTAKGGDENKFAQNRPPVGSSAAGPLSSGTGQPRPPPPAMVGFGRPVNKQTPASQPPSQAPLSGAPLSVNVSIQPQSQSSPGSRVSPRSQMTPGSGYGAPTSQMSLAPPNSQMGLAPPTSQLSLPPSSQTGAPSSQMSMAPPSSTGEFRRSMPEFRDGGRVSVKGSSPVPVMDKE